jgi:hypothetical protein
MRTCRLLVFLLVVAVLSGCSGEGTGKKSDKEKPAPTKPGEGSGKPADPDKKPSGGSNSR